VKPSRFEYHAPSTVGEAVALLDEHGFDAKILAGGQSLVPMMSLRLASFAHLVDLNGVDELTTITRANGHLRIGAGVRQATAEHDATVAEAAPLVAAAIPHIGHFQIRNRGTIGGSIAHADPASELPAVCLALGATMEATGPSGTRDIAADDFFVSTWESALAENEILTAVRFPVWEGASGFAIEEVARRSGDFALVGAAVGVTLDGDTVTRAGIGLFGVGSTPMRSTEGEAALLAAGAAGDLAEVGRAAAASLTPNDDLHASGEYRKKVAAVVVARALRRAIEEARS
jgi:carbon-monoxide dehydrogenase medium subunit